MLTDADATCQIVRGVGLGFSRPSEAAQHLDSLAKDSATKIFACEPCAVTRYGIRMIARESALVGYMELDKDKLDAAALAILSLTLHDDRRVWKGIDWAITDSLYEKGLIENPAGRSKSLVLTEEGLAEAEAVLAEMFGKT